MVYGSLSPGGAGFVETCNRVSSGFVGQLGGGIFGTAMFMAQSYLFIDHARLRMGD